MWLRGRRRPGADCLEIVLEALRSVCVLHKRKLLIHNCWHSLCICIGQAAEHNLHSDV